MPPKRIGILGVGLLGGSIGLAVKPIVKHCKIIGYGHRLATLESALKLGAIDEAYSDAAKAVEGCGLVILWTPVGMFGEILTQIGPSLEPEAVVTDVGSTKRSVVELAGKILPRPERFVGGHPMAGSEKRGGEFAKADLFQKAHCILTPIAGTDPAALNEVEEFWRMLGMRLSRLSPEEHDRLLAEVSHLPHAVAAAVVAMQSEAGLKLSGPGFRDATRIAGGDGGLWRDIFLDNRDNMIASIRRLQEELNGLLANLEKGDAEAIRQWLAVAAEVRQQLSIHKH
jgi:prephenate dehydrogenase